MAVRDYVGLGGLEADARAQMFPSSFATAAFWRMLAHKRMPFAYLGAIYLFEGLTPLVTGAIKTHLQRQGFRDTSLEYIEFHSTEPDSTFACEFSTSEIAPLDWGPCTSPKTAGPR